MELPSPDNLKERRDSLDLTQSELAERAGVSQPLIARIEGDDVDPRLSTLRRIVDALDEAEGELVRAKDVMNEDVVSVSSDDSVYEAQRRMGEEDYSQLPVLRNGASIGSISYSEIRHAGDNVSERPVVDVMADPFPPASPNDPVEKVSNYLDYSKAVIVVESGEIIGIITEADLAAQLS